MVPGEAAAAAALREYFSRIGCYSAERNDPSLNQYQEVEGFIQKLFRLELHLLLVHLFAKIASAGFISGYQIY